MIRRLAAKLEPLALGAIRLENKYPPLFIVGAPRSGTTLVYLHTLNMFDFGYFPNISKKNPKACVSYAAWGKQRYHFHPTYENSYGDTNGPFAPSDGWRIFQRWFPEYDYSQGVKDASLYQLRNIVRLFEIIFRAPFANKNNSNSVRIEYLTRIFPNAFFIHVNRSTVDATISLLEGRKKNKIASDKWWAVAPPQFYERHFSSEVERVTYQIWGVDAYIRQSLEQISPDRWVRVSYDEFCAEPDHLLHWIEVHYAQAGIHLKRRDLSLPAKFQERSRTVPSPDTEEIVRIIRNLDAEAS